ncbi:MAG: GDP-mannose 4,6-dehydratase [Oscillospiraceae bacterium]|jgi:UDP-glucose 4-epimerase|nr:GDP-mannose 4,6-dehydratase [Oscillospiraceae bacterium]
MKALVTGGAGFIGSHLCDALLAEGNEVVCVDNFFIGTRENIAHLHNKSNFKFYENDVCDLGILSGIFAKENIDFVFHLAANSDIQASALNPAVEYYNTYSTTFTLLECIRLHNVKKLFFASTSAVYGEKDGANVAEDTALLTPISYYGGAKLGSEALISAYAYMNDLSALVFRFPNVIGSRLTHGAVFDFIKKLKADNSHLQILGDGEQSKPYMHVSDLVNAILRFRDVPQGVTTYNIGVGSQTRVTRIAEIICEELGLQNVSFDYTGGRGGWKGDVPKFQYDLTKIHKAGWNPRFSSDEAVRLTVKEVLA